MPYPAGLPTRDVSFGQAFSIEGGALLAMRVTIEASRDLIHRPTGSPLIAVETAILSDVSGNRTITLPITDSGDMGTGDGQPIALEPGEVTHFYTGKVEYLDADTHRPLKGVAARQIGPFVVPGALASPIDLDDLQSMNAPTQGLPSNALVPIGALGAPGGVATLDENGRLVEDQTPVGYATSAIEVYDDFTTKPTGLPGFADSGQEWALYDNGEPGAGLAVIDGALTYAPTSATQAAGYLQAELDGPIKVMECTARLASRGTSEGSMEIIAFAESIVDNVAPPPDSCCHPVLKSGGTWDYGVFSGGVYTIIASGQISPFVVGKDFGWRIYIDQSNNTAVIQWPDGSVSLIVHPLIGSLPCRFFVAECFAFDDASTSDRFEITSVAASSRQPDGSATRATAALAARRIAPSPTTFVVSDDVGSYEVVPDEPGGDADADSLVTTNQAGPTGRVLLRLSGWYNLYEPQTIALQARIDTSVLGGETVCQPTECVVIDGSDAVVPASGTAPLLKRVRAEIEVSGLNPGESYTFKYGHLATGLAVLVRDSPTGYRATLSAEGL